MCFWCVGSPVYLMLYVIVGVTPSIRTSFGAWFLKSMLSHGRVNTFDWYGALSVQTCSYYVDETQATLSGINVTAMNMILYIMVAVTCVLMASLIGIIMIIALITIPPAIANMFCNDLKEMMISATVISLSLSMLALLISIATDLPPGATVAIVLGVAFITAIAVRSVSGRIAAGKAAA